MQLVNYHSVLVKRVVWTLHQLHAISVKNNKAASAFIHANRVILVNYVCCNKISQGVVWSLLKKILLFEKRIGRV